MRKHNYRVLAPMGSVWLNNQNNLNFKNVCKFFIQF